MKGRDQFETSEDSKSDIGCCCVPQIVKADMGHLCVTQQLSKIRGDPLPPLGRAVRLCEYKVVVKVQIP